MSSPTRLHSAIVASDRGIALAETALVFGWFVVFLWGGRDWFRGASVAFVVAMLCLLFVLHRRAGESFAMLGLRWDTFGAALRLLAPIVVLVSIAVLGYGMRTGTAHFPPPADFFRLGITFLVSGLLQQYVLLGFFHRRLAQVIQAPQAAVLATATIFAALHLPNVFLTSVTFGAGILCTAIYRRAPNLFANALAHGWLSFMLSFGLPWEINDAMRVGSHYVPL